MAADYTYPQKVVQIRDDGNLHVPSGQYIDIESGGTLSFQGTTLLQGASFNRIGKTVAIAITGGTDTGGGLFAWQNPEGAQIHINEVLLYVTTQSTGSCSVEIGTTATNATTASNNLIDTLSVATTGLYDNYTDKGSNGKTRQTLASGKWVTGSTVSGASAGLVAVVYITYVLA